MNTNVQRLSLADNEEYAIEKGVPAPAKYGSRKYPFNRMEVGDSFFVTGNILEKARSAACAWGKTHKKKFTSRREGGGLRIWRIK